MRPEGIGDESAAGPARRTGAGKSDSDTGKENRFKNDDKRQKYVNEAVYRRREIAYLEGYR